LLSRKWLTCKKASPKPTAKGMLLML